MSKKIIYPLLIIIFSILIIFSIINNKNNNKLNLNIEKFINNKENLMIRIENNPIYMKSLINGFWTSDITTVDKNYNATNLISISLSENPSLNNYGNLLFNNNNYIITFLNNNNIVATMKNSNGTLSNNIIHILFYNNFIDNKDIKYEISNKDIFNSVVSVLNGNTLITKYISFKVENNKIRSELYIIISTKNIYVNEPPQKYDLVAYNKIINNYLFPSNLISVNFGKTNSTVFNILTSKYNSSIRFCVQRVFYSPASMNEIITNVSPDININVINNNQIPNNINICDFNSDKLTNNLNSFFMPKSTILYFYKLQSIVPSYNYLNNNNQQPQNVLQLQNKSENMVQQNILYNDLSSVNQNTTYTYILTLINRYNVTTSKSDIIGLNTSTTIPFSDIENLL